MLIVRGEVMRQLPFDSGNFFVPACERWKQEALNDQGSEYLGDMLRIRTLVQDGRSPQAILRFFGIPNHGHPDRLVDGQKSIILRFL